MPLGKWRNVINIGKEPLKICSIYAPTQYLHGTVYKTEDEAIEAKKCEYYNYDKDAGKSSK